MSNPDTITIPREMFLIMLKSLRLYGNPDHWDSHTRNRYTYNDFQEGPTVWGYLDATEALALAEKVKV